MLLRLLALAAVVSAELPSVYRRPTFAVNVTSDVPYASTLVNCTNKTDASTCAEESVLLDAHVPANDSVASGRPVVMAVHGGSFTGGSKTSEEPPCDYWASRGFVCFDVDYRLQKDLGAYPGSIAWWPALTVPRASWMPPLSAMYPSTRDVRAALRWIHANAGEYGGDARASLTIEGGSAGATAAMAIAVVGGGDAAAFAGDYTDELLGSDATLASTHLEQAPTVTGFIDYWGGLFAVDAMTTKDGASRWSSASPPTIAFHGTNDTTVAPASGDVMCSNLTALGATCLKVDLPGEAHACWDATVELDDGSRQSIFDYAFDFMAGACGWSVIETP